MKVGVISGGGAALALFCSIVITFSPLHGQPAAPEVTVTEMQAGKVPIEFEFGARVSASREVEVRAQAGGILLKRHFSEGAEVKEGDVLFEIDHEPYEAELAKARAQLKQAEAQFSQASRDAERTSRLALTGAGTERARDDALSAKEIAAAAVVLAEAQVRIAELNLGYTKVRAPISGTAGREQVAEGSLIATSGDASLLTTIIQRDPAHVYFSVTESEFSEVRRLLEAQGLWDRAGELIRVTIRFGDGREYPEKGVIDFASSGFDQQTGTLRIRAVVPNPERKLLPGQFVRAIVTGITVPDAIVVPKTAVMQGPQGQFVYTVNSKGLAEIRPVTLGREVKAGWIVSSGLNAGDKVISEGIIKVRPGAPVTATAPKAAP